MNTQIPYSTESHSYYEEPNFTGSPERRLLLAILERAILDFVGNDSREIQGSSDWLFGDDSEDDGEFSFGWVCRQLDLDPESIAEHIRMMPKRGSHRIAPWYLTKNYANKSDENEKVKSVSHFKPDVKRLPTHDSGEGLRRAS